jgi:hypothetical protein
MVGLGVTPVTEYVMVELGGPVKVMLAVPPAQTVAGAVMVGDTTLITSVQMLLPGDVEVQPFNDTLTIFMVVVVVIGDAEKLILTTPLGLKTPD